MNKRIYMNFLNKIKMKGHMAKAVALVMCFALFTTSVDATAFANAGDAVTDEITDESVRHSNYTVEFTYGELQYVLPGDSRVELTTILDTIGIDVNGEISEVIGSNDNLFKPVNEDGTWHIEAVTAFTSKEWLKVKIGEAEYEIVVTDTTSITGLGTLTNPYKGEMGVEELDQPLRKGMFVNGLFIDCMYISNPVKAYIDNIEQPREYGTSGIELPSKTLFYDRFVFDADHELHLYFLTVTNHTISYNVNQATGGSTPAIIKYGVLSDGKFVADGSSNTDKQASISYTLPSSGPTRTGYTLIGWNTKADGTGTHYDKGAAFTATTSDTILYAEWKLDTFTVSFDSKGGSTVNSQEVIPNDKAIEPESPTKANYKFLGWTADSAATTTSTLFDFENTPITAATTLYAIWEPHEHEWKYVADGNKLCAYCTVYGYNCSYYGTESDLSKAIKLELNAPAARSGELAYDGNDYEATITDTDNKWSMTIGPLPDIQYEYKEFGMASASYSSVTDTKDAGYYKASITAFEKTAVKEYQILKKNIADLLGLSMADYEVDGTPTEPVLTGQEGGGSVSFAYKKKDAADSTYTTTAPTTPWGDYTVKADVAETKNYASASKTYDFKITPKDRDTTITLTMSPTEYEFGTDTAPSLSIAPVASTLPEKPTVTYKYRESGSSGEWSTWTGNTSALNVGAYEMKAVLNATATYREKDSENYVEFSVTKGAWKVTSPTAKTGLIYNGSNQALVECGEAEGGTMQYKVGDSGSYGTTADCYSGLNAGTYEVYFKVQEDTNHREYLGDAPVEVTIRKGNWTVTAPKATYPSYTGEEKVFIEAGVVKDDLGSVGNPMLYSTDGESYSAEIPKKKDIGEYKVYYKVVGNDNCNEFGPEYIIAKIEKADRPVMPTTSMEGYTYGQTEALPIPSISPEAGALSEPPTVTYYYNSTNSFDGASEWKNITATTLNVGTYYMFAELSETENYRKCHTTGAAFVISKGTCTITAPTGKTLKYNSQEQGLVTAGSVNGGIMMYSLDDSLYSSGIPKAVDRGSYTVHYYVLGDSNHVDSEKQTVTATIGMGEHAVTAPKALNPVYNGNEQVLISAGSCSSGTLLYSLDKVTYTESISDIVGKDIASYTVYYKVEGNDNYEAYGPKQIIAKIVKKPTPTPEPTSTPSNPDPQPAIQVVSTIQYAETGNPIRNYVPNNPTGSNIPLPYITTDGSKAGWRTIDEALDAHKAKYKNNAVGTLSITMNGSVAVDTTLITDAHDKKIPLSFVLDDEVNVGIPAINSVIGNQAKEGKPIFFRASSMTTAEVAGTNREHAGLLPSDIVAIGGNANTPVVLTLCSNDVLSTIRSQLMTITFNAAKAGFRKGDTVYLYCGTSKIGIAMYKTGTVDRNGFVTFSVPMVSNYWTIGSKNMQNNLLRMPW